MFSGKLIINHLFNQQLLINCILLCRLCVVLITVASFFFFGLVYKILMESSVIPKEKTAVSLTEEDNRKCNFAV